MTVAETTEFTIGAEASCTDGVCGEVRQVVVDPVARTLTHLIVEPKHRSGLGRLVPLDLVDVVEGGVQLRCTLAEFERLPAAEQTQFLPGTSGYLGYGAEQTYLWPYFGLGAGLTGPLGGPLPGGELDFGVGNVSPPIVEDTLPAGEVAVRRDEQVHATDGDVGRVHGLVIDPRNHHVTHVLLQEGHLWGRKEVAIPIGAVASVTDGIRLKITKQEVEDLPTVEVDHSNG
jgi:sporulation protein YlmC with PRC-barrel domain